MLILENVNMSAKIHYEGTNYVYRLTIDRVANIRHESLIDETTGHNLIETRPIVATKLIRDMRKEL